MQGAAFEVILLLHLPVVIIKCALHQLPVLEAMPEIKPCSVVAPVVVQVPRVPWPGHLFAHNGIRKRHSCFAAVVIVLRAALLAGIACSQCYCKG